MELSRQHTYTKMFTQSKKVASYVFAVTYVLHIHVALYILCTQISPCSMYMYVHLSLMLMQTAEGDRGQDPGGAVLLRGEHSGGRDGHRGSLLL